MKLRIIFTLGAGILAAPVAAQDMAGDADAGELLFNRQCTACHVVRNDEGEVLAGRNAKTGPNLHGIVGAAPGSQDDDFAYSKSLVAYGESGETWGEDNIVAFVQNPVGHLREALDDPRARSKMAYRVRGEEDALDIYAFLTTFSATSPLANEKSTGEEGAAASGASDVAPEVAEDAVAGGATVDIAAGEAIYQGSCRNCHGPKARGMASFPKLAGHDAEYLETRLEQYKAGEKVGSNSGLMIPVASELSDEDIANVAAYIAETFK